MHLSCGNQQEVCLRKCSVFKCFQLTHVVLVTLQIFIKKTSLKSRICSVFNVCTRNDNLTYCNNPNIFFFSYFVLVPMVELHVCVVYLLRKSEYNCFLLMQFGFGCKTELLFSRFNCTFCEFHTPLFSYLFLNQKRHFSIKLLKM